MFAIRSSMIRHFRFFTTTTTPTISSSVTLSAVKPSNNESELENDIEIDPFAPSPLRYTLERIVNRLVECRRISEIDTLIQSHKKDPKIIEEDYFSSLIRSYGIASMFNQAVHLFKQMEELGTPRSAVSFNALLSIFVKGRKFDQVVRLFDEMPTKYGFSPDEASYCMLVKSLVELSLIDRVDSVFKELEEKKVEITTTFYTTVLDAFYKKGMIDQAEKLWKKMAEKGCTRHVLAYNVRSIHLKEPGEVSKLLDEMKDEGVKPDITTYYHIALCYFRNNMAEDAFKVYKDLEKNGCVPNPATFRTFISGLSKLGKFELAFVVFKDSVKRNLLPAAHIMKGMVRGLAESSKKEEAKEVIAILRDKSGADQLKPFWKKIVAEYGLD